MNQKLKFIDELIKLERPEEMKEYMQERLTWTVEELKAQLSLLAH